VSIKTVYIASAYSKGDCAVNVRNSILAAENLRAHGYLPFCPLWTHFWHFMSPHPYEYWTEMDLEWLPLMDCILRLPGESSGADKEIIYMQGLGKPVFYSIGELFDYQHGG
jgi:hypothetical protein